MKITKAVFAIVAISSAAAGDAVNPGPTRGLRSKAVKSKSDKEAECVGVAIGGACTGTGLGDCCIPDECDECSSAFDTFCRGLSEGDPANICRCGCSG